MWIDIGAIDERFVFGGARRKYRRLPARRHRDGQRSITGAGRLVDWSIRKSSRKSIASTATAILRSRPKRDGALLDARGAQRSL